MSNDVVGTSSDSAGKHFTLITGPLAGAIVRAELKELQKADLGRKYGLKDRRPLDPPPVVQLQLFRTFDSGTPHEREEEIEYTDALTIGIICHANLFPASPAHAVDVSEGTATMPMGLSRDGGPSSPSSTISFDAPAGSIVQPGYSVDGSNLAFAGQTSLSAPVLFHSSFSQAGSSSAPILAGPQALGGDDCVIFPVAHPPPIRSHGVAESMMCNEILCGSQSVSPICVDYSGKKALLCVFSDLAVKLEGTYLLRYRVFDILMSLPSGRRRTAIAECVGGPFKIYSTKDFPGLRASTDLTKHLSYHGVRLNCRESERPRKQLTSRTKRQAVIAPAPL